MKNPAKTALLFFSIVLCSTLGSSVGHAQQNTIEVDANQRTTIIGTFDSLSLLLRDLCGRAGVEMRSFDATDRSITTRQVGRPLSEVIGQLLTQENYLLGVRDAPRTGAPTEIAWIRVTGSTGAAPRTAAMDAAVLNEPPRPEAHLVVADRLFADEQRVAQFMATDNELLAESLRHYPNITVSLRKLRDGRPAAVQRKLDELIQSLEAATP